MAKGKAPLFEDNLIKWVYNGKVRTFNIPSSVARYFKKDRLSSIGLPDLDDTNIIDSSALVHRALDYLFYIKDGVKEDEGIEYDMYDSGFKLICKSQEKDRQYRHIDMPSYYHLYISLIDAVNKVIIGSDDNLINYQNCCNNLDLFFRDAGLSNTLASELVAHYEEIGAISKAGSRDLETALKTANIKDSTKLVNTNISWNSIGFSFFPSGFLIPYHMGIMEFLTELNIINVSTPLSGSSSGSLAIISALTFHGFSNIMETVEQVSHDVYVNGPKHRLDTIVSDICDHFFKDYTHELVNDRIGEIKIAYTTRNLIHFKGTSESKFKNTEDLKMCLRASCNIPFLSSKTPIIYKSKRVYDGMLSLVRPFRPLKTNAVRTVKIAPYTIAYGQMKRQLLLNDYIQPKLYKFKKEQLYIHYIRLKGLLYELWQRKIRLPTDDWKSEVRLCISVYEFKFGMGTSSEALKSLTNCWEFSPKLLGLFNTVVKFEIKLDVMKYTAKSIKYNLDNVDILSRLGNNLFMQRRRFLASPILLIDWLNNEARGGFFTNDDHLYRKVRALENLLYCITPPMKLLLNYVNTPELLHSALTLSQILNTSLYSTATNNIRYIYDIGRCDAFRWLIKEYISFENWMYLEIVTMKSSSIMTNYHNTCINVPIHKLQTKFINDTVGLLNVKPERRDNFNKASIFTIQNNAVKSAILSNCIHPYYTHILTHEHFWINK